MRLLYALLILLLPASLLAQDSLHITKVGHLAFPNILADVQGYAAPNGDEYAIVGHELGVSIVSLATPSAPVVLFDLPGSMTIWREIETFSHYAYVSNEFGDGLRIIDLSGLPGSIAFKDTILDTVARAHTLYISDTVLYLFGTQVSQGADIFSLADPWNPVRIGAYTSHYVHDGFVRDKIGYMAEIARGHMTVVDLHDPLHPVELATISTPTAFTHNTWLSDDGLTCYTTDELDDSYVTAYDVSNLANLEEIARFRPSYTEPSSKPHNVKVFNDFLVTAYYSDGVHIVDAHRPHNLVEVGYYDTYPTPAVPFNYEGVWGADPYMPSGLIIAGDRTNGLFILDPDYRRACYLEGTVTDASTGQPIHNADITLSVNSNPARSNSTGEYATGTVLSGTATVTYHKFGYRDSSITVTLSPGVVTLANIPLQPISRVRYEILVQEAGTGIPLSNAKVRIDYPGELAFLGGATGSNGMYIDSTIIAGQAILNVVHWGHQHYHLPLLNISGDSSFTIELERGYEDHFMFDLGWTASSTAAQGDWVRVVPIGTTSPHSFNLVSPPLDCPLDYDDQCYVTGNNQSAFGINATADDVDLGTVVLRSPPMDLSLYQQPVLSFYRWFMSETGPQLGGRDTLWMEIDNGSQTVQLRRLVTGNGSWTVDTFLLASFIPLTSNMTFSLRVKERQFDNVCEAAMDFFRVRGTILTDRPAPTTPNDAATLTIAPNPINDHAMVAYDLGSPARPKNAVLEVHDMLGRTLHRQALDAPAGQLTLTLDLPTGVYLATLRVDGQTILSTRLLR